MGSEITIELQDEDETCFVSKVLWRMHKLREKTISKMADS